VRCIGLGNSLDAKAPKSLDAIELLKLG